MFLPSLVSLSRPQPYDYGIVDHGVICHGLVALRAAEVACRLQQQRQQHQGEMTQVWTKEDLPMSEERVNAQDEREKNNGEREREKSRIRLGGCAL